MPVEKLECTPSICVKSEVYTSPPEACGETPQFADRGTYKQKVKWIRSNVEEDALAYELQYLTLATSDIMLGFQERLDASNVKASISCSDCRTIKGTVRCQLNKVQEAVDRAVLSKLSFAAPERLPAPPSDDLNFSSRKAIEACLAADMRTNGYLKEKGINESAANFFACSTKVPHGVLMGASLVMFDHNEKLGLAPITEKTLALNLSDALQDCAKLSTDSVWTEGLKTCPKEP